MALLIDIGKWTEDIILLKKGRNKAPSNFDVLQGLLMNNIFVLYTRNYEVNYPQDTRLIAVTNTVS